MLAAVIEFVSGLWEPTNSESQLAKDTRKRADRAYGAAWKARSRGALDDGGLLLRELQANNVPGSFSDPATDPFLSAYFDSWRDGKDPKVVRSESARYPR